MARSTPRSFLEIVIMVLLGLLGMGSLIGVLIGALVPDAATGQLALQNGALCLGPLVASASALGMIGLRNRARKAGGALAAAILSWFIGITVFGMGIFTTFSPGEHSFLTNLGYSLALCLTPGGILALVGAGAYLYDQRKRGASAPGQEALRPDAARPATGNYAEFRRRAAEYRRRVGEAIQAKRGSVFSERLNHITSEIGRWEQQVGRLVDRLEAFDADEIVRRDRREIPEKIARLENELALEADEQTRGQIGDTLAGYREQQAQLDDLTGLIRRTQLQLDQTLAAMGTIYSQVQTLDALEVESDRARRISDEIDDQVAGLADLLEAVSELQQADDQRAKRARLRLSR